VGFVKITKGVSVEVIPFHADLSLTAYYPPGATLAGNRVGDYDYGDGYSMFCVPTLGHVLIPNRSWRWASPPVPSVLARRAFKNRN